MWGWVCVGMWVVHRSLAYQPIALIYVLYFTYTIVLITHD